MANPAQVKFDEQASAGLWIGSLIVLAIFGWPFALAFFVIKLLVGTAASTAKFGNSYRNQ